MGFLSLTFFFFFFEKKLWCLFIYRNNPNSTWIFNQVKISVRRKNQNFINSLIMNYLIGFLMEFRALFQGLFRLSLESSQTSKNCKIIIYQLFFFFYYQFSIIKHRYLHKNKLTGTIPTQFSSLTSLLEL